MIELISPIPGVPFGPWKPLATLGNPWRPLATMPENGHFGHFDMVVDLTDMTLVIGDIYGDDVKCVGGGEHGG